MAGGDPGDTHLETSGSGSGLPRIPGLGGPARLHQGKKGRNVLRSGELPPREVPEHLSKRAASELAVENLHVLAVEETRVVHPCGPAEPKQLFPEGRDVPGEAGGLVRGVESTGQPPILGRYARRAMAGMAALSLDAAHGHHGLPSYRNEIGP